MMIDEETCLYPDWEGGLIVGKHHFDKDGYCTTCGYKRKEMSKEERKP